MAGTYDPDLNLIYWEPEIRRRYWRALLAPGMIFTPVASWRSIQIPASWCGPFNRRRTTRHDWDAVEIPVLVDGTFHGQPKKMLMQASRNGYFFVLDRTNGKSLLTVPFGPVNWASGVDKEGRPMPDPVKEPSPDGVLIAPDEGGLTNYRSPSFDPKTGLFIVDAHPAWSVYFNKPADGSYGWAGADYGLWGKGVLEAIDYQTGKIRLDPRTRQWRLGRPAC